MPYFVGSTVKKSPSATTALKRASGSWIVLLISPSFGITDIGNVYFRPSPPLRGRIITTAKVPGGDFSAATCTEPWPGLAPTASITPSTEQGQGTPSPL